MAKKRPVVRKERFDMRLSEDESKTLKQLSKETGWSKTDVVLAGVRLLQRQMEGFGLGDGRVRED